MSADATFTKRRFEWLDAIATDPTVPDRAFRVAYVLASKYLNRTSGDAWPAQATLATECGTNDRRIRDAIDALVARGYLASRRRGRGLSNSYEPILDRTPASAQTGHQRPLKNGQQRPVSDVMTGQFQQGDRTPASAQTGHQRPTNPLNEPLDEPLEDKLYQAGFAAFWRAYPKRVGKGAARRAYDAAIKTKRVASDELIAGAERYAAERRGQPDKFTKHPATWLRSECWTDEALGPAANVSPAVRGALDYGADR